MRLGMGLNQIPHRRKNIINKTPLTMLAFGDSMTAYCGGYQLPYYMLDTNTWTISKSNPCTITIPGGHSFTTGMKCGFFGFIGLLEINEIIATVTCPNSTTIQLDGVNSSAWTGTYIQYGRIYADEFASVSRSTASYLHNMDAMLGNRINFPTKYLRGVPGDPASNFINRLPHEFPASLSDVNIIHIFGGRNDLNSGVPAATVFSSLVAARNWVWADKGSKFPIIMGTVCPNNAASAAIKAETVSLNNLIRASESTYCRIADYDNAVNDGAGNWKAHYNIDIQHQASAGGWAMGQVLKNKILPIFGRGNGFVLNPANKIINPGLSGTGGTAAGITNNGLATGWTGTLSGAGATATRELHKNSLDKQVMSINSPSGSGVNTFAIRQDISASDLSVGDKYIAVAELKCLGFSGLGKVTEISLKVQGIASPSVMAVIFGPTSGAQTAPMLMNEIVNESLSNSIIFTSPEITFLEGQVALRLMISVRYDTTAGEVVMDLEINNAQLYKITT